MEGKRHRKRATEGEEGGGRREEGEKERKGGRERGVRGGE